MITPVFILALVLGYFILLVAIAKFTAQEGSNQTFFIANKSSPWYLVAFGMVGASLSGVTFISVPGWVEASKFSYLQVVIGYFVGYLVVAYILLPLYYKANLTSIYEYLAQRFGNNSHAAGAFFFFVSRVLGASFRLFLVAIVLQNYIFELWGIPFELTVVLSILFIWIYTQKGGIKTIVWTDTLQTALILAAAFFSVLYLLEELNFSFFEFLGSTQFESYSQVWVTDSLLSRSHFLKSFLGGAFITICMTGLDQDMMQKNLSCRSLADAQKNMVVFSVVLVFVTAFFMVLGALLFSYAAQENIAMPLLEGQPKSDLLFPEIALRGNLGWAAGITFILGLIAAAYSSADSALTALTTSFCIDFLKIDSKPKNIQKKLRQQIHIGMAVLLIGVVILFKHVLDRNVIDGLLTVAGYTYGPLLGLFAFGIFTPFFIKDQYVWIVVLFSVALTIFLANLNPTFLGGYVLGYELLPLNGLFTFIGLVLIRRK